MPVVVWQADPWDHHQRVLLSRGLDQADLPCLLMVGYCQATARLLLGRHVQPEKRHRSACSGPGYSLAVLLG